MVTNTNTFKHFFDFTQNQNHFNGSQLKGITLQVLSRFKLLINRTCLLCSPDSHLIQMLNALILFWPLVMNVTVPGFLITHKICLLYVWDSTWVILSRLTLIIFCFVFVLVTCICICFDKRYKTWICFQIKYKTFF